MSSNEDRIYEKAVEIKASYKTFFTNMDTLLTRLEGVARKSGGNADELYERIKEINNLKYKYNFADTNFPKVLISDYKEFDKTVSEISSFLEYSSKIAGSSHSTGDAQFLPLFIRSSQGELDRVKKEVGELKELIRREGNKTKTKGGEKTSKTAAKSGKTDSGDFSEKDLGELEEELSAPLDPAEKQIETRLLNLLPINNLQRMRELERIEQDKTREWVDQVFQKHHLKPDLTKYIAYRKKKLKVSWMYKLRKAPSDNKVDYKAVSLFSEPLVELIAKSKRIRVLLRNSKVDFLKLPLIKNTRRVLTLVKDAIPVGRDEFIAKETAVIILDDLLDVMTNWNKMVLKLLKNLQTKNALYAQLEFLKKYVKGVLNRIQQIRTRLGLV